MGWVRVLSKMGRGNFYYTLYPVQPPIYSNHLFYNFHHCSQTIEPSDYRHGIFDFGAIFSNIAFIVCNTSLRTVTCHTEHFANDLFGRLFLRNILIIVAPYISKAIVLLI